MAHIGTKLIHVSTGQVGIVRQAKMDMYLVQFGPTEIHSYGMYHETEIQWAGDTVPLAFLVLREATVEDGV